jgi:hypothetical protein
MIQLAKNILELHTSCYYDTKNSSQIEKIVITFVDKLLWYHIKKANSMQPKPAQQKPNPAQHCIALPKDHSNRSINNNSNSKNYINSNSSSKQPKLLVQPSLPQPILAQPTKMQPSQAQPNLPVP